MNALIKEILFNNALFNSRCDKYIGKRYEFK